VGEREQSFDNFDQWVSCASRWLTRHPQYLNTAHPTPVGDKGYRGDHFTAICFDTAGRICRNGGDMMRARDEGCFPVRWVWPDEIPEMDRRLRPASPSQEASDD
jgi:hypothetical protein